MKINVSYPARTVEKKVKNIKFIFDQNIAIVELFRRTSWNDNNKFKWKDFDSYKIKNNPGVYISNHCRCSGSSNQRCATNGNNEKGNNEKGIN